MGTSANDLPCDGCGLRASPEHIAERLRRLELSTRFRPVHIGVLFVVFAPPVRREDDFYGPAGSKEFSEPFLEALEIHICKDEAASKREREAPNVARLMEFQRRGYYLSYLSECPILESTEPPASTAARLAATLIRRIRFNYKPKHVAPIGQELFPIVELLKVGGQGPSLILDRELALPTPSKGDQESLDLFRRAVSAVAPRENLSSGYDRIQLTHTGPDFEAGGNT